ncbi:ComEC/Rec2 family competence protein [Fidelibacter multiformis]|uniref:ComEC/Rec2 family competence protein n=1 Tax=Fidelibacter multiformis TaxID=3377529 RepID=UPI0037DC7FBC
MIKTHHLNVGHGDTILIEFFDTKRLMVIDCNRSAEFDDDTKLELINEALSMVDEPTRNLYKFNLYDRKKLFEKAGYDIGLTDPIDYINNLGYKNIFRFIQTHPHLDHFKGMNDLFESFSVWNIWCIKNNFTMDLTKLNDSEKVDWALLKKFRDTNERKIENTTIVRPYAGHSRDFWREDNITVLSPTPELVKLAQEKENRNIMSYVLLVEHGGHKLIFGGDAEKETWEYILDNYEEKIKNVTVIDASHHGRDSGYYQPAVKVMNPEYVVVSVGKKPSTDATNKYKQYARNVWSTRWKGNITFTINSDGSGSYDTQYDR